MEYIGNGCYIKFLAQNVCGRNIHNYGMSCLYYYSVFCVCPRVPDGELIGRIIADNDFTEGVAVSYLSQLLSAVDCLHQLNIAHLDIRVRH